MSKIKSKIKLINSLNLLFFLILGIMLSNITLKSQANQKTSQIDINAGPTNYKITLGHPYNWIDASSGIELTLGDDYSALTTLPFNFSFYDGIFDEIYIITEGYLTFSFKSVKTIGIIPSSNPHRRNIIAPYWTNLDGTSGDIYIKNFTSHWVVAWENFNHDNGSFAGSFETILYNDGDIVFNYDILQNINTYACGLNYGDGNNYSSYNELPSSVNDFSIKFSLIIGDGDNPSNGGLDSSLINIIVGIVVTIGIVSTAGGITLYYYKKNPEQFKAKFSRWKEKIKESASKLKKKVKNNKNRIKQKTPKEG
ncbi:MAG: hypothetical protein ACFFG0_18240 [Candidatus Thorarchaeota archaeon]